jgi:hypothetical protein
MPGVANRLPLAQSTGRPGALESARALLVAADLIVFGPQTYSADGLPHLVRKRFTVTDARAYRIEGSVMTWWTLSESHPSLLHRSGG